VYTGQWLNNDRNGRGSVVDAARGTTYEGAFRSNVMCGQGMLVYPDGNRYEGPFQNNVRSGPGGKMSYLDGGGYEGPFLMDREHGEFASMTYPNGDVYHGTFAQGLRDGFGTQSYASTGDKYSGMWKTDKRSGKGTMIMPQGVGTRYIGQWLDGVMDGKGNFTEGGQGEGSASYYGQFTRGKPHGKGQKKYADGSVYEGEWIQGNRQGQGTYTYYVAPDHTVGVPRHVAPVVGQSTIVLDLGPSRPGTQASMPGTTASSQPGSPISPGGISHRAALMATPGVGVKDIYTGTWHNDKPQGAGVLNMESQGGDTYEGNFAGGSQSGQGVCNFADGSKYDGRWRAGHRDGKGKIQYGNGDTYDGDWVRDQRYGKAVVTERRGTVIKSVEYSRDRLLRDTPRPLRPGSK
jgi:hypothetical protein